MVERHTDRGTPLFCLDNPAALLGDQPTMGFEDVSEGSGGYATFSKGANALIKLDNIDTDVDDFNTKEGEDPDQQLNLEFDAVEEAGDTRGTLPAYYSSKINITDGDMASHLGLFLKHADILEDVLQDLGADDDLVEKVVNGEKRYEAHTHEENLELMQAIAKHYDGQVLRAGTKAKDDYSVVKEVYTAVDQTRSRMTTRLRLTLDQMPTPRRTSRMSLRFRWLMTVGRAAVV